MIFTLFYMYATALQWWKLGVLKNKLSGTLNSHNALLVCSNSSFLDRKRKRCLENLLVQKDDRLACTIVPKQVLDLTQWAAIPKDNKYFPIFLKINKFVSKSPKIYVLIQTNLDSYTPHQSETVEIENFGEPIAWRVDENFEMVLKTDLESLTKFAFSYCDHSIDMNHELELLKIETVDIVGSPVKIKYDKKYTLESRLRYSLAPPHWKKFVEDVRSIYNKINNITEQPKYLEHPRITIETTHKPEEVKKVPVSEVKPIKKEHHRKLTSCAKHEEEKSKREKNKLDVSTVSSKRSKSGGEHRDRSKDDKKEHRKRHSDHKRDEKHKEAKHATTSKQTVEETEKENAETSPHKHKKETKTKTHEEQLQTETKENNVSAKEQKSDSIVTNGEKTSQKDEHRKLKLRNSEEKKLKREASFEEKDIPGALETNKSEKIEIKVNDVKATISSIGTKQHAKSLKPPNVLVFADSGTTKNNIKSVLKSLLNNNKYTLYDFPANCTDHSVWSESTGLLVVCGSVPANLTSQMLHYLLTGGHVLCMCSDLLYSVLQCFSTAEVREHELVRFSYGNWKQVQMMHHVFCYQASPAKKQFSKDSDQSSQSNGSRGSSPVAPRTPSSVEIQHNGKKYLLQIQVLGTEETWQTPSLLLASVKNTSGTAIFSQVHLEIDPTEYEGDESKYEALKGSDKARLDILKHILTHHLQIDCDNENKNVKYTPGYFLGRHNSKQKFLIECKSIENNVLENEKITVKFYGKDEESDTCTSTKIPVYVLSCPSNFSTVQYFETLNTEEIGRLVIYSDILTSSMHFLSKTLIHGLAIIPRQQTNGIGRAGNTWLSPIGCAMFSLQLHIQLDSPLGKYLPLVQHLAMVSIVSAIKNLPGCEDLDIGIKWPNDIYAYKQVKIGGAVVSSVIQSKMAIINIGVGMNLSNSEPTTCINDVIKKYNEVNNKRIPLIEYERYFAYVFNELEKILNVIQNGDLDYFYNLYYQYWLHSGMNVKISNNENETTNATIIGIDDYGFLKVRTENGKIVNVQPDGNSFNMLTGLISPKFF